MWATLTASLALSLLTQTVAVIVAAAARPRSNIYLTIIWVSLATAPAAFLAGPVLFEPPLDVDGRVYFTVIHLALGGLFLQFMTLPDRSVTLRILVELLIAPGQRLSVADLNRRYGVRVMIESRVRQLAAGRFLEIAGDGTIALSKKGRSFGRFVVAGRRLFRIESAN